MQTPISLVLLDILSFGATFLILCRYFIFQMFAMVGLGHELLENCCDYLGTRQPDKLTVIRPHDLI